MKTKDTPKRKAIAIKVYTLPDEYQAISANARRAGLDMSVYLRRVGMGTQVKSIIDISQIAILSKVNADLGRFGGLLKLWLTDHEKRAGREIAIRNILRDAEGCIEVIKQAVKRL